MAKELIENITCECGHVEQRKIVVIENLGQFVRINPPLKATMFETFVCSECGGSNIIDSKFSE